MAPKSKVRVCGPFRPDPDVPPDQNGRGVFRTCHLVGEPGDAHHTLPDAPEHDARRLAAGGER